VQGFIRFVAAAFLEGVEAAGLIRQFRYTSGALLLLSILGISTAVTQRTHWPSSVVPSLVVLFLVTLVGTYRKALELERVAASNLEQGKFGEFLLISRGHDELRRAAFTAGSDRRMTVPGPGRISAVRFTAPIEKTVWADDIPVILNCEPRWRRFANRLLGVKSPRLIVQGFTPEGVLVDLEDASGKEVVVDFYEKPE
jgi:hypothetical protein